MKTKKMFSWNSFFSAGAGVTIALALSVQPAHAGPAGQKVSDLRSPQDPSSKRNVSKESQAVIADPRALALAAILGLIQEESASRAESGQSNSHIKDFTPRARSRYERSHKVDSESPTTHSM